MRCDSIPYESLRNETNRIFIAFISESIEKFTALEILSGTLQFTCRLPARRGNTCAQTRTQMQTQTQTPTPTQAPTGSRQRVEAKRRTPLNLRLPTIHLVASAFLTQRFHFIFFGKFLACSARWHCMKFAQLPVGCSLFFSTFHIQLPLFFSVDCPPPTPATPPSPPLPPFAVVLVKHFVIVYFTLAFVLYLFSISTAPTVLDLFLPQTVPVPVPVLAFPFSDCFSRVQQLPRAVYVISQFSTCSCSFGLIPSSK